MEIYAPYSGAGEMLLHRQELFTIENTEITSFVVAFNLRSCHFF